MQILIVDDDEFALNVLDNTLSRMGYKVVAARDGCEAMEILRRTEIRLAITDWDMPNMNGLDLCRSIRQEDLSGYVYIIMLTGREGAKERMEGLCAGADDFLSKPLDPEEMLICLKQAERILALETRDLALFALAKLAESRDSETGEHVERVQSYTRLIAKNLSSEIKTHQGVDEEYIRLIYQTSPLHDLGKVGIPDSILLKPGKLTTDEFAIMETHTLVGAQTLDAALERFPNARFLQIAREIAATHHERFDGTGYPLGLAGQQIPLCGRIVAVADVYDALTSRRIYKEAMTHQQAKNILLRDRGSHFDPEVVDAFLRAEDQILAVRERLRDKVEPARLAIIPPPPRSDGAGPSPCKLLIVEDDPVLLEKLINLLTATGEPVFQAIDGEEGLELWREHSPRVVISDWVMPKKDGVELCRDIRKLSRSEPTHFIMLTANSDRDRLLDAYKVGVDDFIAKPFDHEELLARVRAGIRTAKLHDELVRKAAGSQALNAQLATVNSRLERLSITDELTGLFNRRHAMSRLEEQWALAERYSRPLSIAMIDIDHFKRINDTYGHDAGDSILRRVAVILREQTRGTDVVCRVGGEEFLIIFPAQSIQEARICAERCRVAVEAHAFIIGDMSIKATVSIGVAIRAVGQTQYPDLLKIADQVMYAAKHLGRNIVRTSDDPPPKDLWCELPKANEAKLAAETPPARPPVDLKVVLKRCGGDTEFANAVAERFHAQAAGQVDRIRQALTQANGEALSRAAHSLKSMAAYMAADMASDLARQIEDLGRRDEFSAVEPLLARLSEEIRTTNEWIAANVKSITDQSVAGPSRSTAA
jgi:putative two-component system response regulator